MNLLQCLFDFFTKIGSKLVNLFDKNSYLANTIAMQKRSPIIHPTTVNSECYKGVLERLPNDVRRKKSFSDFFLRTSKAIFRLFSPYIVPMGSFLSRQCPQPHLASTPRVFSRKKIPVYPHPPHSPNLASQNF